VDTTQLIQHSASTWEIAPFGKMRVPAILYASEALIHDMDQKVYEQVTNVATLPGIVKASYAMPDAHWGYGFPIGGVAAFDPEQGGVISAGGVGFDISCAVRCVLTGLTVQEIEPRKERLAEALFLTVPAEVWAAEDVCASTKRRWRRCLEVELGGRWSAATACPKP
jgi:tRNA-splicing ligase RtcB